MVRRGAHVYVVGDAGVYVDVAVNNVVDIAIVGTAVDIHQHNQKHVHIQQH